MQIFIQKQAIILFLALICLLQVHSFFAKSAEAQMPSHNILSKLVSSLNKPQPDQNETATQADSGKRTAADVQTTANVKKKFQEEEQNLMEDALTLLAESEENWKQGNLEDALDLLDQAYALIIETDSDPAIARQKDDLRLLISKRILAVYSSRQTTTSGKRSAVPLVMNADVEKEIRSFQTVEREFFISAYQRSGLYRPMILQELKKAGLPEELSWLPLVESGFKVFALSRARALGPWQFIPSTGYKYGLNRDDWVDERMDPEKSTRAAIGYLKDLHDMFGDWLTVLAAYNCGEGRVLRVISSQHLNYLDRFWDLYHMLPYETARYVPRFLATLHIVRNPAKYAIDLGMPLEKIPPYAAVESNRSMRLRDIAAALDLSEDTLNLLNPELRHRITPDRNYPLKVPAHLSSQFQSVADSIQQAEKPQQVRLARKAGSKRHKVKRGESIASIAHRYGVSVNALMASNGLTPGKRIYVGQRLVVPGQGTRYVKASAKPSADRDRNEEIMRYKVKKGDTMASIAQRYGTTIQEIKRLNNLKGNTLKVGQMIRVGVPLGASGSAPSVTKTVVRTQVPQATGRTPANEPQGSVYTVQKGDSLQKIARENNTSLIRILELNRLDKADSIHPGQTIIVK